MRLKQSTIKSLLVVARRGKTRAQLNADALAVLTALINLLTKETLSRCAQHAANVGESQVSNKHLQRVIAQIMLDFCV